MEQASIPQDDVTDVLEMTSKMLEHIADVVGDNDLYISMSALISASTSSIFLLSNTLDEVIFYRNVLIQTLDNAIRNIIIRRATEDTESK